MKFMAFKTGGESHPEWGVVHVECGTEAQAL